MTVTVIKGISKVSLKTPKICRGWGGVQEVSTTHSILGAR